MKKALFIIPLFAACFATGQLQPVQIPGSHSRIIQSTIVGQEYELQILLPGDYDKSEQKYPVVYLMDSQWDFPLVKSIYGQQYYDGFIPGLIIVGVTWGGSKPNPDSLRARDYTPTREKWTIQSGGADKFLSFMKQELFPFIEKNYRAKTDNRTLMGCSLGGLLTLYTMFTHTDMFTGYAAASPAIGWDNEILYKYEKDFSSAKLTGPVRLYMTVGDVERGRASFEKMAAFMINRHNPAVSIHSKVLENTGHSGTKSETYSRGLQYIFERPVLKLSTTELSEYAGSYKTQNGIAVELKIENDQLVLYFSGNNRFTLYAAKENEFYATSEFLNLHFKKNNDKIEAFELEGYGGSETVIKIIK